MMAMIPTTTSNTSDTWAYLDKAEASTYGVKNNACVHIDSAGTVLKAEDIGYTIIIPTICAIGAMLNIINLVVLCQKTVTGICYTFLSAMAAADLITLVLVFPIGLSRCSNCQDSDATAAAKLYEIYVYMPLANTSTTSSVWFTVAVTFERYVSIRKTVPVKKDVHGRARWVVFGLSLLSLLTNIPYFFVHTLTVDNVLDFSDFGTSDAFTAYSWIRISISNFIPTVAVAVFNSLLVYAVWDAHKKRKLMVFQNSLEVKRQRSQIRLTAMLIGISIGFLLAHIPESMAHPGVAITAFGECIIYTREYKLYRLVCNIIQLIASSYHFILYITCNDLFYNTFISTFLPGAKTKVHNSSKHSMSRHTATRSKTQESL